MPLPLPRPGRTVLSDPVRRSTQSSARLPKARFWLGCAALALAPPLALGQEPTHPAPGSSLDSGTINNDRLGGIVINRTMTVLGWDFYSTFSEIWEALHPDSPYMLTIIERPTAQFGSEIWVDYRDIHIFHTFLSPARSGVKEASQEAVNLAYQNIQKIEQARKEFDHDADLGPEEM
jgi:curli production assembly/transport component CsgE